MTQSGHRKKRHRSSSGKKSECWRTGVAPLAFSDNEIVLIEIDGEHSKHEVLSGPGGFS